MCGESKMWWARNKLTPTFKAQHPGKTLILAQDNAPYNKIYTQGVPIKKLNLNKVNPKIHAGCCIANLKSYFPGLNSGVTILRDGTGVPTPADKIGATRLLGGATLGELRPALHKWFTANAPDELLCDLERGLKKHGFEVVWTPPLQPRDATDRAVLAELETAGCQRVPHRQEPQRHLRGFG